MPFLFGGCLMNVCFGFPYMWVWVWVEHTPTPSWIFEGGADDAIQNYTRVFARAPETFVDPDWYLPKRCGTVEKQKAVAWMLATNATLTGWDGILHLFRNNIGAEGAKYIGEGVKHSKSLKELFLNCNNIGDEGAMYIGEGVKHSTSLIEMYMVRNNLSDEAKSKLTQTCVDVNYV